MAEKIAESPPGRQMDLRKVIRPVTMFSLSESSGNRKDVSGPNTGNFMLERCHLI